LQHSYLFEVTFTESIAELERLAGGNEVLEAAWPANAVGATNSLIQAGRLSLYKGMYLLQAWRLITPYTIAGIVDAVRTRILDLALSLETLAPDAGQPDAPTPNPKD